MIVMVAAMFSKYHCFVEQIIIVYHTIDYINVFHCCWILTVDYTDYSYWLLLLLWLLWLSLLFLLLLFVLIFLVLFGGNLRVHVDRFPKLGMPIANLTDVQPTWGFLKTHCDATWRMIYIWVTSEPLNIIFSWSSKTLSMLEQPFLFSSDVWRNVCDPADIATIKRSANMTTP